MPLVILVVADHGHDTDEKQELVITSTAQSADGGACQHEIAFYEILREELPKIAERVKALTLAADDFIEELIKLKKK